MDAFLKKILTVLAIAFTLVYVGYQAYMMLSPSVETEHVYEYTAYQSIDVPCMIIRRETVIPPRQINGYLSYVIEDGSRVSKEGTIAELYRTESDALAQNQYDRLTAEIELLKTLQMQSEAQNSSLSATTAQINLLWEKLVASNHSHHVTDLARQYSDLQYYLNKQQIISGKVIDFTSRISELTEQKTALAASFHKKIGSIDSPLAGYFVSSVDGYENAVDIDKLTELSVEQIQQLMKGTAHSTDPNTLGKVVADYDWYILCVLPKESAAYLSKGVVTSVRFPFVSDAILQVEVVASNKDKTGCAATVLKCSTVLENLIAIRNEQLQVRIGTYTGLRVPDSALQFIQSETTGQQLSGVYVRNGNTLSFRKIHVLYHSEQENYSICEIMEDRSYLQLYDSIVIGGKDLYDGKVVY